MVGIIAIFCGVYPGAGTAGEFLLSGERSDAASVGARFIAPAGWGVAYTGVNMLNSPAVSGCNRYNLLQVLQVL